ncbi:AraC family transcriptional regulator [Massilia sp. TS11]|uniref:AraC family transcriptional regulator n=1 Tax=Massilia sp. TS11 TaxID=2908003 RepID=UPI001EDC160F|nr:AraC family transcriptional regulator [Massilia sp. TS11]MCG2584493.1 AraC family transcriptional regulator [Massilia sp. TS11]
MSATLTEALAANPFFAAPLFDALPDVVFFVKDADCRYVLANHTLARRCGMRSKEALVGKTAAEVFRPPYGETWLAQDQAVLASGQDIDDKLELHLYPDRDPGWCLTRKLALRDAHGKVVGLCGISRDLAMADKKNPGYQKLAASVRLIQEEYGRALSMPELARTAGMSVAQLERYFVRIFQINPRQMLIKTRLDAASRLLAGDSSIAQIALACGYSDHSAFTRQFKATVGLTPAQYRAALHKA